MREKSACCVNPPVTSGLVCCGKGALEALRARRGGYKRDVVGRAWEAWAFMLLAGIYSFGIPTFEWTHSETGRYIAALKQTCLTTWLSHWPRPDAGLC